MKIISIILSLVLFSFVANAQVTISTPYQYGDVFLTVNISYPSTIVKADSVRLEACYQEYSEVGEPKVFKKEKTVKGLPSSITRNNYFRSKPGSQNYRVVVYQGGKATTSNEVTIDYNAYKYSETALPKVKNFKAVQIDKDGKKYVTLTWDAVPNAFGYMIGEEDAWSDENRYIGFQLADGSMSETGETSFTFEPSKTGKIQYGVVAVNTPYDSSLNSLPFEEIASVIIEVKE